MIINKALLTRLREAKPWTQGEMAIASGLSLRTIQRAERDGKVSLDTKKALAAALDIDVRAFDDAAGNWEASLVKQLLNMQNTNSAVPAELIGVWEGDYFGTILRLDIDKNVITPKGPISGASPYAFKNNVIYFGLNGRIQLRQVKIISKDKMSFTNFENEVTVEFDRIS